MLGRVLGREVVGAHGDGVLAAGRPRPNRTAGRKQAVAGAITQSGRAGGLRAPAAACARPRPRTLFGITSITLV